MHIEVRGDPAPQGSKRFVGNAANGRPRMIEQSKKAPAWREAVRAETQRAVSVPFTGPVQVVLWFELARPHSTPRRVLYPFRRPDWDKLARAVCDGLQAGGAFHDDAQIVECLTVKRFAANFPGCSIIIAEKDSNDTVTRAYIAAMLSNDEPIDVTRPKENTPDVIADVRF
jgi:Holliday junction resolvase RusA-like endonuclease